MSSLEKPKTFIVCAELCSIENDCLTSTFKMKRNIVSKRFMGEVGVMYEEVARMEAALVDTIRK